jgi:hypothetical protein
MVELAMPGLLPQPRTESVSLAPRGDGEVAFEIALPEEMSDQQTVQLTLRTGTPQVGTVSRKLMLPVRRAVTAASAKVNVDGDIGEWGDPAVFRIALDRDDQVIHGIPHTRRYVMDQHVDWFGPDDCSARASVRHDADNLYVAVRGTDNKLVNSWTGEPIYIYMEDSVEVFIDGRPDDKRGSAEFVGLGVYHLKIAPKIGDQDPVAYVSKPRDHKIPGLRCASTQLPDGYALELQIPKSAFPGFDFSPGNRMGLSVQINDHDGDERAHLGAKSVLNWAGTRGVSSNPSKFSTLFLK